MELVENVLVEESKIKVKSIKLGLKKRIELRISG